MCPLAPFAKNHGIKAEEAELAAASLASASTEPEAATRSIEHCCSAPYPLYHPADEAAAAATVVEPFKF
mgnify:CR=1 FL=1